MRKIALEYIFIVIGSIFYAIGTVFFIFPNGLLLGGTSGISVILNAWLPFSPGTILVIINIFLLLLAFFTLGREMAIKTLIGSILTTVFIGVTEYLFPLDEVVKNNYFSAILGAIIIAIASGIMFYVDSSSGGTDIVALIVKKYTKLDIGKALLVTDVIIVLMGGVLSGWNIAIPSFIGLLIKTLGIDFVIFIIKKYIKKMDEGTEKKC